MSKDPRRSSMFALFLAALIVGAVIAAAVIILNP